MGIHLDGREGLTFTISIITNGHVDNQLGGI